MNELIEFSLDTENAEKNYNLAKWYENQHHTAAAHTYYLRCAERTNDDLLAYESLIRSSLCYKSQGFRVTTEKVLLENALMLLPERPEAYYFLSLLYATINEWQQVYINANLGLQKYNKEIEFIDLPEFSGKYALIFQKAIAAWEWGKGDEFRELFKDLYTNYWDVIDTKHKNLIPQFFDKDINFFNNLLEVVPFTTKVINSGGSIVRLQLEHVENSIFQSPSILINSDNTLLVNIRNFNFIYKTTCNHFGAISSINLQIQEKNIVDTSKLDILPLCEWSGLEDARLVKWNDKVYLCGNDRDNKNNSLFEDYEDIYVKKFGKRTIVLSEVQIINGKPYEVSKHYMPCPEGDDTYCEKNWMPILDMPYHFIRWTNPTQIVKYDIEKNVTTVVCNKEHNIELKNLRGSSQVIPWNNGYVAIVHTTYFKESLEGIDVAYKYGHRFIFWDKNWNLTNFSDEFVFFDNGMEYSGGLVYNNNEFLISVAIHESENYIIKFPSLIIEDMLKSNFKTYNEIPQSINEKISNDVFDWGDLNLNVDFRDYIKDEIQHGIYTKFFDVEKNDIVFDIGSSVGPFTDSIMNKLPKEVHCFEPNKGLFKTLSKNLKNYDNVFLNNYAISSHDNNDVVVNSVFNLNNLPEETTVNTITFKSYIENNNIKKIDFLKTDCEGGEWFIFTAENYDWIHKNVHKIAGEFHLHDLNMKESFIIFRDLYLKNAKNVVAFVSNRYAEVGEFDIWDNNFIINNLMYCNISFEFYKDKEIPNIFNINTKSQSTVWVTDNIYDTPDEIRNFALQQEYFEGGFGRGFIGRRTVKQFLFPGLKEKFESIMGRPITNWEDYCENGKFQICWSGEPLVYHCDAQKWGGMLYLTPNAPYQCGTTLYAHKKTRARSYYDQGWDDSWKENIPGDTHLDRTPFEPVDVVGNVYNRLVIFDASCIHSASEYFGSVKENGRLWQMFFFDTD